MPHRAVLRIVRGEQEPPASAVVAQLEERITDALRADHLWERPTVATPFPRQRLQLFPGFDGGGRVTGRYETADGRAQTFNLTAQGLTARAEALLLAFCQEMDCCRSTPQNGVREP